LAEDVASHRKQSQPQQVAYRTSAWSSYNPKYVDKPVDDPDRQELLMLHIAEKSRYEVWTAPIRRSASGLPRLDDWTRHASDPDGLGGALPKHIRAALDNRRGQRGPTMPAADLVRVRGTFPRTLCQWLNSADRSITPEIAHSAVLWRSTGSSHLDP
jgi:hypothetical protein